MSLTGNQLIVALSQFIDDYWAGTTTSSGSTTQVVDTALQRFGDKSGEEGFIRLMTDSAVAGNLNQVRRVTTFLTSTATVAPAFPQVVAGSINYEFHRYDPAKKFYALDRARLLAFPQVAKVVEDETLTSDGITSEIPVPTSIRRGPAQVWVEVPLPPSVRWNILTNPILATATSWTATSVTAATYSRGEHDMIIPRLESSCVKLTSGAAGNLNQPLGAAAAATYAGRQMTFGAWVYSMTAGCTVAITDDSATSTSSAHQGLGWEFLQVTRNIVGSNATTLTVKINPLTNNAVYVERAYFGQIAHIDLQFIFGPMPRRGVYRDDSHATLMLERPAPRGFQYRLVGRTPVTALGTNLTTQTTNAMEVGDADMDLLLATAARILFTLEGMSTGEIDQSMPQIQMAEARFKEMQEDWRRKYPRMTYLEGWG